MALHIRDLQSGYGKQQILFGVDIEARLGEVTLLIGPNGAGKSTVLKSVFGFAEIYKGQMTFANIDLTRVKKHNLIQRGIVYIPQGRSIFPNLSVRENLEMGGFFLARRLLKKRVRSVFEDFPILALKTKQPARLLSGGQQQILAMGRALIYAPRLLLLDEPSLGLSPVMMESVFEKIVELKEKRGIGTLLVEQNAKAASAIADKIYLLENGQVVLSGGKEVLEDERIKHVYLGGV
jgi:ABC-type branched-subunit amino acid transport system ATPase component